MVVRAEGRRVHLGGAGAAGRVASRYHLARSRAGVFEGVRLDGHARFQCVSGGAGGARLSRAAGRGGAAGAQCGAGGGGNRADRAAAEHRAGRNRRVGRLHGRWCGCRWAGRFRRNGRGRCARSCWTRRPTRRCTPRPAASGCGFRRTRTTSWRITRSWRRSPRGWRETEATGTGGPYESNRPCRRPCGRGRLRRQRLGRRAVRHAEEDPRQRHHHDRAQREFGAVFICRQRRQPDRLFDRAVRPHRRCGEAGAEARQADTCATSR